MRTRVAIVGLRIHAGTLEPDRNHGLIKSFRAHEDVKVVAYCEWDPGQVTALEALQQADPEAGIFHSLDELLTHEVFDVAVVMLPPNEAVAAAFRLAEADKHLFIEKQGARTASELLPLRRLAKERELVIQAGYPWPLHPVAQEVRSALERGLLGTLLAMEARLITVQVGPGAGQRDPRYWMYSKAGEGGGILHMEGGHWLALFQHFAQAPVRSVTALCSRTTAYIEEGLEDVATVALDYANGVHACLHMGYLLSGVGPRNDMFFAVRGTDGAANWEPPDGSVTVVSSHRDWSAAPARKTEMQIAPRPVYADQWGYQFVAAFVEAVRHGLPAVVSLDDAYEILQIVDAAYESTRTGRRILL